MHTCSTVGNSPQAYSALDAGLFYCSSRRHGSPTRKEDGIQPSPRTAPVRGESSNHFHCLIMDDQKGTRYGN
jgi:hypothetical protein